MTDIVNVNDSQTDHGDANDVIVRNDESARKGRLDIRAPLDAENATLDSPPTLVLQLATP